MRYTRFDDLDKDTRRDICTLNPLGARQRYDFARRRMGLDMLIHDPDPLVRTGVAEVCPSSMLPELVTDPSADVRAAVALRPLVSTQRRLAHDPSDLVRYNVSRTAAPSVLATMVDETYRDTLANVARRCDHDTKMRILERMGTMDDATFVNVIVLSMIAHVFPISDNIDLIERMLTLRLEPETVNRLAFRLSMYVNRPFGPDANPSLDRLIDTAVSLFDMNMAGPSDPCTEPVSLVMELCLKVHTEALGTIRPSSIQAMDERVGTARALIRKARTEAYPQIAYAGIPALTMVPDGATDMENVHAWLDGLLRHMPDEMPDDAIAAMRDLIMSNDPAIRSEMARLGRGVRDHRPLCPWLPDGLVLGLMHDSEPIVRARTVCYPLSLLAPLAKDPSPMVREALAKRLIDERTSYSCQDAKAAGMVASALVASDPTAAYVTSLDVAYQVSLRPGGDDDTRKNDDLVTRIRDFALSSDELVEASGSADPDVRRAVALVAGPDVLEALSKDADASVRAAVARRYVSR